MYTAFVAVAGMPLALAAALRRQLEAERSRWVLWTPVAFGVGISAYFCWSTEPDVLTCAIVGVILVAGFAGWIVLRAQRPIGAALSAGICLVAAGFLAAVLRTGAVAAPILPDVEHQRPVAFVATLISQERLPDGGARLLLACPAIEGLAAEMTPRRLRLTLPGRLAAGRTLRAGDRIVAKARLAPPQQPVAVGSYDAARALYFQRVGAIGQVTQAPTAAGSGDPCVDAGAAGSALALEQARRSIADLVLGTLGGETGAVALAFIIGDQRQIPEAALQAMRDAGLAHLLSISGLHLVLVGGLFLVAIRRGLALWPAVALRLPLHKLAAVAAAGGTFGYMLLADSPIPTQRAFVAFALMMLAVLVDRHPVSLRLVAWSALVVLVTQPESLLGASFQMSFAAVVALIAAHEAQQHRRSEGIPAAVLRFALALLLTSVIAGLATGPIGAYHFNRVAIYGLVANMIAVPVTGLLVMPGALIGLALWPVGLHPVGLVPMGWGIDIVLWAGRAATALPGAVAVVASYSLAGFLIAIGGLLWLCLWRGRWRWWGAGGVVAGLACGYLQPAPDLQIAANGRTFAVRDAAGEVLASGLARRSVRAATWARRAGQGEVPAWPRDGFGLAGDSTSLRCDAESCLYRSAGRTVALLRRIAAFREDCRTADVILLPASARQRRSDRPPPRDGCNPAAIVLHPSTLRADGGVSIWLEPSGIRIASIRSWRGDRPWTRGAYVARWPRDGRQPLTPLSPPDSPPPRPATAAFTK